MKYHGRILIPVVAILLIAAWHGSYFLIDRTASYTFLIKDHFINYDFIYTPFILPFFWWMGKKYDEARFGSERDPLTMLYNRRFVWREFPELLETAQRDGRGLYVYVVDINDFKRINDTYGHELGDLLIKDLSIALLKNTSRSSLVARWGGDEFLVITSQISDDSLESQVDRIEGTLGETPYETGTRITLAVGGAAYPSDATTPNELIRIADERMYEHKLRAVHADTSF